MSDTDALIALFSKILSPQKSKETVQNKKLSANLHAALTSVENPEPHGALLYTLASTIKDPTHIPYIANSISSGSLKTGDQVAAAIKFTHNATSIDDDAFNVACGVGVVVSDAEIKENVAKLIKEKQSDLFAKRWGMLGVLIGACKNSQQLKWANPIEVKQELEEQMLSLLGPRDDPKNV